MAPMLTKNIITQIRQLLAGKNYGELKRLLPNLHTADIAELLDQLPAEDSLILFRLIHKDRAAEVFSHLGAVNRKTIISSINRSQVEDILEKLSLDDKIDFLGEMPASFVKDVIASIRKQPNASAIVLLRVPIGTEVEILDITDGWAHIRVDRRTGYMLERFLDRDGAPLVPGSSANGENDAPVSLPQAFEHIAALIEQQQAALHAVDRKLGTAVDLLSDL